MNLLDYKKTIFLKSYSNITDIEVQNGIEIAFIGYSNSGKSSAINALTNQKKLVRFSKIPGRTQLINFFQVTTDFRIVDLPGYGYAKAPLLIRRKWQQTVYDYLVKRKQVKGLVLLMDIRYPLKYLDQKIIDIALYKNLSLLILLTKCDKLSRNQQHNQFKIVFQKLHVLRLCNIELFSSIQTIGIERLKYNLNSWYNKYYILNI